MFRRSREKKEPSKGRKKVLLVLRFTGIGYFWLFIAFLFGFLTADFRIGGLAGVLFSPEPYTDYLLRTVGYLLFGCGGIFFVYYRIGKNRVQFKPVLSALSLILAGGIRMLAAFLTHFPLLLTNGAGYYGGFLLRYLSDRQAFSPDPEKVSDRQFLLAMLLGEILFLIAAFLGEKYGCIREGRIRQEKMSKGQKL